MATAVVIVVLVVLFACAAVFMAWFFAETETRLGRSLTPLELIGIGVCLPYSLLLLIALPAPEQSPPSQQKETEIK